MHSRIFYTFAIEKINIMEKEEYNYERLQKEIEDLLRKYNPEIMKSNREEDAYERLQKEIDNLPRKYNSEITEEELQNAVTDDIGAKYTQDWSKLIKVPEGLTQSYEVRKGTKVIANLAFGSCTQLTSVTIPDSVKVIGIGAFFNCYKLQSIVIPESVEYIREGAFVGCLNLEKVDIPNPNLKTIESMAFAVCESLTDCQYSKTAKLGVGVFLGCKSLKNKPVEELSFEEDGRLKHYYKEGEED